VGRTFGNEKYEEEGHLVGVICSMARVNMIDLGVKDDTL